jgi:hypothetical protein
MADDELTVTLTLRGTATELVDALANGLTTEDLVALREAFIAELETRAKKETDDAPQ